MRESLRSYKKSLRFGDTADLVARQLMLLCLLLILGAALWKIRSRGVFLAAGVSSVVTGLLSIRVFRNRYPALALLALLGLAAAGSAAWLSRLPRYRGRAEETHRTMVPFRLEVYRQSLEVALDHPFFGVGFGGIRSVFPAYQNPKLKGYVFNMHSDWLDILLQAGPLGLLGYGLALLALGWAVLRSWQEAEGRGFLRSALVAAALLPMASVLLVYADYIWGNIAGIATGVQSNADTVYSGVTVNWFKATGTYIGPDPSPVVP